jgi:hypothetical protein
MLVFSAVIELDGVFSAWQLCYLFDAVKEFWLA